MTIHARVDGSAVRVDVTDTGLTLVECAPGATEDEVREKTEPELG